MSRRTGAVALLLVALVTLSTATAGVAAAQRGPAPVGPDDSSDPPEDAYVQDDGDVILVYEGEEAMDDGGRTEFGVDVASNLAYMLAVQPLEGENADAATGQATAVLRPSGLNANGTFSVPRPDSLESLSFELTGQTTSQNARSDMTLETTFDAGMAGRLLQSASLAGNMTVTGSTFRTAGSFDAQMLRTPGQPQSFAFDLRETGGGYTLEVQQERQISSFAAGEWDSRSAARATIERQFAMAAEQLGGSAEVTLESYSFTEQSEGGGTLDVAFTVRYEGVKEALASTVARQLATSQSVEMSQAEIDSVTQRLQQLTLDRASVDVDVGDGQVAVDYGLEMANYTSATLAMFEVAAASESQAMTEGSIQRLRSQFEAMQAADLRQRYEWTASFEGAGGTSATLTADFQYRTDNWAAYVSELESRGLPTVESTYDLSANTEGDSLNLDGTVSVQGEDVIDTTLGQYLNASRTSPGMDQEAISILRGFRQANLSIARADVNVSNGNVTFEAGAQFGNLSALGAALDQSADVPETVSSIVGRTENDTLHTYVRVRGAVSGDASESDVRALDGVAESTTIHMPGTYDREFPEMDVERAANYLGVTPPETNGAGPGFGVAVAVLALLGAALVAARRE
ncbi:MAG: PGF-CTERM sorting domain-containing protein [Halorientalis sp.]